MPSMAMEFKDPNNEREAPKRTATSKDFDSAARAVSLYAIADGAENFAKEGASPLEVQTYVNGARRELAAQYPDVGRMNEAFDVASRYKSMKDQVGPGEAIFNP